MKSSSANEKAAVELIALQGRTTRRGQAFDRQLQISRRLLAACDGDLLQAVSAMRMIATAPCRHRPRPSGHAFEQIRLRYSESAYWDRLTKEWR